jgi:hypothetical protein
LNVNTWIRQIHRWLSLVFPVGVVINTIAVMRKEETALIGFTALIPLMVLLLTGLYLFILPHAVRWRRISRTMQMNKATPS